MIEVITKEESEKSVEDRIPLLFHAFRKQYDTITVCGLRRPWSDKATQKVPSKDKRCSECEFKLRAMGLM